MSWSKQALPGEQSFSNYSGVQRIILFRSGTSHKILMVTSSWDHVLLPPLGLVPRWKGLQCQFRGDWSQRMASSTSESDSNTFECEEMQYHLSYYFFSLTTDVNCSAQNPQVPAVKKDIGYYSACGVRVLFFFLLAICQFPFVPSQWILWRKATNGKCGSSFLYKY